MNFLGCSNYPACSKVLWLPKEIESAKVNTKTCTICKYTSPIHKLDVVYGAGVFPYGHETNVTHHEFNSVSFQFLACIGGCDDILNDFLGARNRFDRWIAATDPPPGKPMVTQKSLTQSYPHPISYLI